MPQLDSQQFLDLLEDANKICFLDIESTGLRADYGSALVVSIKPFTGDPVSFHVEQPGNDQKVVRMAKEALEQYDAWVTYYGKGFDVPFLNTRLLRWKRNPIAKRHHIDLYFSLKSNLLVARRSLAHMLRFLDTPEQKMDMSPNDWNLVLADPKKAIAKMVKRCESDTTTLCELYKQTRHLIRDVKK